MTSDSKTERDTLLDLQALCRHADKYTPEHFARKVSEKVEAALSAAHVAREPVAYQWRFRGGRWRPCEMDFYEEIIREGNSEFEARRLYTSPPTSAASVGAEEIKAALIAHFKSVISASAGMPFEETDVHLPEKSFDGYANAILSLLSRAEGGRIRSDPPHEA